MFSCHFLLLTWVLLTARVQSHSWRPCTGTRRHRLPLIFHPLPLQVQMVQSKGSRGLRMASAVAAPLNFPASQIFTNCYYFPSEFSLVATVKIQTLRQKTNEYIFSVVREGSDSLLLGLRVSENRLHFLTTSPGPGGRSRMTFKDVGLDNNHWHTVVLAVTGSYATLTVDCGLPLELKQVQSFPSHLSTRGSRFFVGSRGRWRGRFSGLLRQLVLLPGSDATPRLCPSPDPTLTELSIPQVLKTIPFQPDQQGPVYTYEAEARVTLGDRPPCSRPEQGQLWFNAQGKGLFICDGLTWRTLLQSKQRLDYVEDYQDLYTRSETLDVEYNPRVSPGRDSRTGSGIYRWTNASFQLYQNISTQEARSWKHFTIDDKIFLVVAANFREAGSEWSVIYQWHRRRRRFVRYQTLETHTAQDWEAFRIHNHSFLVVANHRRGKQELFEVNQTLLTSGAYDWEFFTVGPYHFLVVANTFDGRTTTISSTIYVWLDGSFQTFQSIPTVGATDWEPFQIDGRFFLAVANSQMIPDRGTSVYSINSTVYELNTLTQTFIRFQDILTHSALDWEFFTIGDEKFLVVANSHDGSSYSLNSVVYRWQGYEGFVPVHSLPTFGCRDWEDFSTDEGSFLIYSSAKSRLSKVFKLRNY
ncbi:solute carrier family 41 [Sarotherodon galilaeus]